MTAALEPCPNPECPGSEPVIDQHPQILTSKAVRVICLGCQTCGPLRNTEAEARRLWNALPRAPRWTSEPPPEAVDEPIFYLCEHTDRAGDRFVYPSRQTPGEPRIKPHPAFRFCVIPQPPTPAERSE